MAVRSLAGWDEAIVHHEHSIIGNSSQNFVVVLFALESVVRELPPNFALRDVGTRFLSQGIACLTLAYTQNPREPKLSQPHPTIMDKIFSEIWSEIATFSP
jgi:hypothetical protein